MHLNCYFGERWKKTTRGKKYARGRVMKSANGIWDKIFKSVVILTFNKDE
jgi:hypothetical protein